MEIVVKSLLGALVALAIHYSMLSKHAYLSGLIAAAPIFSIFAHSIFASAGRYGELQASAQFHILSFVPTGTYLLLVWWLATRINIWIALLIATIGWGITSILLILAWNKGDEYFSHFLNTRFVVATIATALACTYLITRTRWFNRRYLASKLRLGFLYFMRQGQIAVKSLVGLVVVVFGSTYLLTSPMQAQSKRLPGEEHLCALLQSVITLGPNGNAARQIQHSVVDSYLSLAKNARSAGDPGLATMYSSRARDVLFGPWVHATERKPIFC